MPIRRWRRAVQGAKFIYSALTCTGLKKDRGI
jgi:hypothetical protein